MNGMERNPGDDVNAERRLEQLGAATAAAAARLEAERAQLAALEGAGVMVGDLRVLAATAAWPVEWAVLAAARSGRWLAAPADTQPLAGSGDLDTEAGGPLVIRCGAAVWVDERALLAGKRSGRLPAAVVERARFLHRQAAAGGLEPTEAQAAVELDPEHRQWLDDVVAPARAALLASSAALGGGGRGILALPPRVLGLAASVLLLISLAAGGGLWREGRRAERLAGESEALRQRLSLARGEGERMAREAAGLRVQLTRLQAARAAAPTATPPPAAQPLLNVPFVWLAPDAVVRGEPVALQLPAEGELFLLIVPLDDPTRTGPYRLTVRERASRRVVWSSDGLVRSGAAELTVALPRRLFTPGDYVVALATAGSAGRHLADFPLRLGG
jgi:hypothetical protein